MMFVDRPMPDKEYSLARKYFNGEKLSRAERQRWARMKKRTTRAFLVDMTVFMFISGPLLWFVMSKAQ